MKLYWHKRKNNNKLILLFNGWGCDENIVSGIDKAGYDLLLVYDYTTVEPEKLQCTEAYQQVDVIAWSFGVPVANDCLETIPNIGKRIAVNGTLRPIDDEYGIPTAIFQKTLQGYNDQARRKFFIRIMGGISQYAINECYLPQRTTESQLQELKALAARAGKPHHKDNKWDIAVISLEDKIFPSTNMRNAWGAIACLIEGDHFVSFQQLINDYL